MSQRTWSGERARSTRETVGLSPDQVADRIGVHRSQIYRWEAGTAPRMRHAVALADLYGISIDWFFIHGGEGDTTSNGRGRNDDGARRDSQPEVAAAGAERE